MEIVILFALILVVSLFGYLAYSIYKEKRLAKETSATRETSIEEEVKARVFVERQRLERQYKESLELKDKEVEETLKAARDEAEQQLQERIKELDSKVGEILGHDMLRRTLFFDCVCKPDLKIPCVIDFTEKEHHFSCPECGARYRADIYSRPVFLSRVTNPQAIFDRVEGKHDSEQM